MSKIAHEIETLKTELGWNQTELAAQSGIDVATLSRLRTGERQISFDDVKRIRCIAPGIWPARILKARLLDEVSGPGSKQISIAIRDEPACAVMRDDSPPYLANLSPKVDKALKRIAANVNSDAKLRDVVLFLAQHLPEV